MVKFNVCESKNYSIDRTKEFFKYGITIVDSLYIERYMDYILPENFILLVVRIDPFKDTKIDGLTNYYIGDGVNDLNHLKSAKDGRVFNKVFDVNNVDVYEKLIPTVSNPNNTEWYITCYPYYHDHCWSLPLDYIDDIFDLKRSEFMMTDEERKVNPKFNNKGEVIW